MLLVLDNCEHLVTACAALANQLLQACDGLRILATSRERLDIYGETVWHVPPLSVPEENPTPSAEQVGRAEAAQLFIEWAQASVPGFELTDTNALAIERICRQLDGIPLALELAAARLTALSVHQIAERLDDALKLLVRGSRLAPARQRTLRAALAWSYGMLSPAEQVLFDRLSVFAGGWTLEAAESVCADLESSGPAGTPASSDRLACHEVLDLLTKLVEKSLVIAARSPDGAVHFRTLETLRQFGWERLTERGSVGAVADRHAEFFLALAERAEPELLGHAGSALDRLEHAHDNLRAALRRLLDLGAVERAERLVGALGRFWLLRCYFTEGERWLVRVLQLAGSERRTSPRARCLYVLASLALSRGDFAAAEAADQAALTIWRELGDAEGESWVLFGLGQLARLRGEYQLARTLLNKGVKVSRVACQPAAGANWIGMLADLAYDQGDDREALLHAEAELACSTAIGWRAGIGNAQRVLGQVRAAQGDHRAAKALLEASLATYRELRARGSALTLARLSELAMELGDLGAARQWLANA